MKRRRSTPGQGRQLTLEGQTRSLSTWAQRLGVSESMVRRRLARGYSPRTALFLPPGPRRLYGVRILAAGEDAEVLEVLGHADVTVVGDFAAVRRWMRGPPGRPSDAEAVIVATERFSVRESVRIVAEAGPDRPVALFGAGALPPALERAARDYGSHCWPVEDPDDLYRFLCFAAAFHRCHDAMLALGVADLAARCNVRPYLAQIIAMDAIDLSSREICRALRVGPNTLKTHVRHLLQATDATNLDRVAKRALRFALARANEHLLGT